MVPEELITLMIQNSVRALQGKRNRKKVLYHRRSCQ